MINYEALYTLSYGIYLVSSGNQFKSNGYIANTVFQVSADPVKLATSCNKKNQTAQIINETGHFAVSVLHQDASKELISKFGYSSGDGLDKFKDLDIETGQSGVPVITNDSVAFFECKVVQRIDVGTHWLFIGDMMHAKFIDESKEPLSYAYYRKVFKAESPEKAPTYVDKRKLKPEKEDEKPSKAAQYRCTVCGFIYDEEEEGVKFDDLPDDWKCPVCGTTKDDFVKV